MRLRKLFIIILLLCEFGQLSAQTAADSVACTACQRLILFNSVRKNAGEKYWPSFGKEDLKVPLVYFTNDKSFLAFSAADHISKSSTLISCNNELKLFKFDRIDSIPFHMENKMTFNDALSPYYFKPFMFCSDVETTVKTVPVFKTTEDWLQLVMHEYFHSFQFSHTAFIKYFAAKINIQEDSLRILYLKNPWFSDALKTENGLLLSAIDTENSDSVIYYIKSFIDHRLNRRKRFLNQFQYDISATEDFWEKTEGTARYMEYYSAFTYNSLVQDSTVGCDSFFHRFSGYRDQKDIGTQKNFSDRTKIMQAYYYVTGFNMCRLLDKLKISYKEKFFDNANKSIFSYFIKAI